LKFGTLSGFFFGLGGVEIDFAFSDRFLYLIDEVDDGI
jgi:hypothetical protein